jgi:alkyl hydroperoxide reductase subunit AhpC
MGIHLHCVTFESGRDAHTGLYYGVIRLPIEGDAFLSTRAQDVTQGAAEARARYLFDRIRTLNAGERASGVGVRLGDTVPDFSASSTKGPIDFYHWAEGSWVVLFSHAKDFTAICSAEMRFIGKLLPEFTRRGVKVLGLSVDPTTIHDMWLDELERQHGIKIDFPIIGDLDRKISELYGLIHPNASDSMTVRGVFLIDPDKILRLHLIYPAGAGRDFREILRVVDALHSPSAEGVSLALDALADAL